jgi:hypothetical protein
VKITKINKRVSYWTISNPVYRIKDRYFCNLAQLCRDLGLDAVRFRALVQTARLANETSATLDGWILVWHYNNATRDFLVSKGVILTPEFDTYRVEVPVLKKHQDKNDDAFISLVKRLNHGSLPLGSVK